MCVKCDAQQEVVGLDFWGGENTWLLFWRVEGTLCGFTWIPKGTPSLGYPSLVNKTKESTWKQASRALFLTMAPLEEESMAH